MRLEDLTQLHMSEERVEEIEETRRSAKGTTVSATANSNRATARATVEQEYTAPKAASATSNFGPTAVIRKTGGAACSRNRKRRRYLLCQLPVAP